MKVPCVPCFLVASLLLAAAASGGCAGPTADSDRRGAPPPAAPPPAGHDPIPESLRSLPYVDWDPRADTSLRGVTQLDPARVSPGYNFYSDQVGGAHLITLDGKPVHTWRIPSQERACEFSELLRDGDVLMVCKDRSLTRLAWDSTIVWDLDIRAHHDVEVAPDGTILAIYREPRSYRGRLLWFDGIAWVSPAGEVTRRWFTFDHLDELQRHHPPSPLDRSANAGPPAAGAQPRGDYYHTNTVEVLPDTPLGRSDPRFRQGNLLICLRNANVILVLAPADMEVTWSWGPGQLQLPHMPTMLESGNILVFDNGTYRKATRVLEIDPPSGRIVWSYAGNPPEPFFVEERGCSERLPNGNTLICDSERGHVFEVTPGGETVWEFWNPEIQQGSRKRLYRLSRLEPAFVERILEIHE